MRAVVRASWVAAVLWAAGCGHALRSGGDARAPAEPSERRVVLRWEDLPAMGPFGSSASARFVGSDGIEMPLESVDVHAFVEGPLAYTEVHLRFSNPTSRVQEGDFSFALPAGAAVSRFAMRVGDEIQEGEVLERSSAALVYRSYVAKRRDPGLLTEEAGNVFRFLVFPVEPNEQREIVLSYSEELETAATPYRFPLRGLPALKRFSARLVVNGKDASGAPARVAYVLDASNVAPDRDLCLRADQDVQPADAVRAGRYAVARVVPRLAEGTVPLDDVTVLLDTSASRAEDHRTDAALVTALARDLGAAGNPTFRVVAFDQDVETLFEGRARDYGPSDAARVVEHGALGATDLRFALAELARRAHPGTRVLAFTDCRATIAEGPSLSAAFGTLRDRGLLRVDVHALWPTSEMACVRVLTEGGRAPGATFMNISLMSAQKLQQAVPGAVRLSVPGARWVYPEVVTGLAAGRAVVVHADLPEGAPWELRTAFETRALAADPADGVLVARAAARARILNLLAERSLAGRTERGSLYGEIVGLSERYRVLSPFTSFLVLESQAEYDHWKIDRTAEHDVLVAGEWTLERRRPSPPTATGGSAQPFDVPKDGARSREMDRDQDGVPDPVDECPDMPSTDFHTNGCPAKHKVLIEGDSTIELLEPIRFPSGSAKLPPESVPLLDEIADVLKGHPDLGLSIEGHADPHEKIAKLRTSRARAESVRRHLVERGGIHPSRFSVKGFGDTQPITRGDTEEERAKNRRVSFRVVEGLPPIHPDPAPPGLARREGALAVAQAITVGAFDRAVERARVDYESDPSAATAAVLGEALEAAGKIEAAGRAYGSLLDLAEGDWSVTRAGTARLEHLLERHGERARRAADVSLAALRVASDGPQEGPMRALAAGLLARGQAKEAYRALFEAVTLRRMNEIRPDLEIFAAAFVKQNPSEEAAVRRALEVFGLAPAATPSLSIELDAVTSNPGAELFLFRDHDGKPEHVPWGSLGVWSGEGSNTRVVLSGADAVGRYFLGVQSAPGRVPAEILGSVLIVRHDGHGHVTVETRPFLVELQNERVDLGAVE